MRTLKKNKYLFVGGVFGITLTMLAIASVGTMEAGTVVFLAQDDTGKMTPAELGQYQQLDCSTITNDIKNVQLVLSGPGLTSAQNLQLTFGRVTGKGDWAKLKTREVGRSETVKFSSQEAETVLFTFTEAVRTDMVCPNPDDMAYMRLEGVNEPGLYIHGSLHDSYAGPLYSCVLDNGLPCTGTIIDMAFSFLTYPNTAPSIEVAQSYEVVELETLTFTLKASDAEGDAFTWGSGNLPEGATLDAQTGEFVWTPTSEQVKDYKITFVVTDNGAPVQESSDITVFVSVLDTETVPESNQLLEEMVVALEFEKNVENSYIANVQNVERFIKNGQIEAAKNQLEALAKKVDQDYKKENITETQYNELTREIYDMLENLPS